MTLFSLAYLTIKSTHAHKMSREQTPTGRCAPKQTYFSECNCTKSRAWFVCVCVCI